MVDLVFPDPDLQGCRRAAKLGKPTGEKAAPVMRFGKGCFRLAPDGYVPARKSGQRAGPWRTDFDAIVIGGGPGGYNTAIRLGQLGLSSACIDKRGTFGGTCLNIGCIPSKALLHAQRALSRGAAEDFAKLGIKAKVDLDLPQMMAQKAKVVGELTKGVEFLLKKTKAEAIVGEAASPRPEKSK